MWFSRLLSGCNFASKSENQRVPLSFLNNWVVIICSGYDAQRFPIYLFFPCSSSSSFEMMFFKEDLVINFFTLQHFSITSIIFKPRITHHRVRQWENKRISLGISHIELSNGVHSLFLCMYEIIEMEMQYILNIIEWKKGEKKNSRFYYRQRWDALLMK